MFSPYRHMDSYPHTLPHHRDHVAYPCHHYPSWEVVSPQTRADAPRPISSFGPWTTNGSVIYPSPTDHNGCCSHSYPPGYYSFRPPYSHIPPPPQVYYHGPYPPYCDSYPSFVIPPLHYSADQNPYDYNNVKAHCCGCPNHTCKGDNNSVKIEEQNSEKDRDNESSSLVRLPNYPYPVVWTPPSYSKDKETNKSSESSPALWNGWIPLDINSPNGVKQDRDGKKSLQTDERKNQFPWPIIWMPGDHKLEDAVEDLKEINSNPKVEEKLPSKLKIIPLKLLEDEKRGEKPGDTDDKHKTIGHPESVAAEKESRTKTIPVRHIAEDNQKTLSTNEMHKDRKKERSLSIPEKQETGAKMSSDSKQLSQAKTSKLPPVCLRVDPLPRKKTANGASRSPSPPGLKDKEAQKDKTEREQPIIREKKEEMPKKEIQVVDVNDKLPNEAEKLKKKSRTSSLNEEIAKIVDNQQSKKGAGLEAMKVKTVEVFENGKADKESEKRPVDKASHELDEGKRHMENMESIISEQRKERKILSQSDAATFIQSAYRGFEVRRWQPLEKLRKIQQIRQKAEVVKKQIDEFEASSKDQKLKQKAVISETIMNLLLQLDTIQGLHQSVRDVRKSVARELISLQEKLDALGIVEHETMKVEYCPTDTGSDCETISAADSSAATNLEPEHVSSQSVEATHPSEVTFMDGKEAAIVKQQRDVEAVMAESPDSATGPDKLNVEMDSTSEEHEEITSLKEQPRSILGEAVESHLMAKEQSFGSEEVIKPLTSTSQQVFEAPSTCKDEVTKLETDKHLEGQGINASSEQVGDELFNAEAGNDAKSDIELKKSSMLSVEGEAIEAAAEESKPEFVQFVEPTPGVVGRDVDVKATMFPGDKVDTTVEELQVPVLENNDLVRKTVVDTDAVHMVTEVPCSEQAVLCTCSTDGENAQWENLEKQVAHADRTVRGLPVPTQGEGHSSSGALEPAKEDEMNSTLVPDAMNIIKDECLSSDETFETNVDEVDGAALEEEKDGLVFTEDMSPLSTSRHVSVPTNDKRSLEEAVEPCKEDGTNLKLLPDAVNINKEVCITTDGTFEANVNKIDDAATEEEKDGLIPIDDVSPSINLEATVSKSNSLASGQEEGLAHPDDSAKLNGLALSINLRKEEKKLVEENEKLREMLERLLEAGKEQLLVIADLNGRVKDLERKLSQKKRCKVKSFKPKRTSSPKVVS